MKINFYRSLVQASTSGDTCEEFTISACTKNTTILSQTRAKRSRQNIVYAYHYYQLSSIPHDFTNVNTCELNTNSVKMKTCRYMFNVIFSEHLEDSREKV